MHVKGGKVSPAEGFISETIRAGSDTAESMSAFIEEIELNGPYVV